MLPDYAELHCVSGFSFLRGASQPEELVERAHALGYAALALTDECSLAGVVRAHVAAKGCGLKLIVGSELRLADGLRLALLACDREGYGNLSGLITRGRRRAAKGGYRLSREDLADGLPGCLALLLPDASTGTAQAGWLRETFGDRCRIAAELLCGPDDRALLARLESLARHTGVPLVAAGDVHMHMRGRRALQDTLTAIRLKTTVAAAGHALHPNGERHLRRRETLARIYPPELLAGTLELAERCDFSLDSLRYEYPEELVPAGETPSSWLRRLTEEGLARRFGGGRPHPHPGLPPRIESGAGSEGEGEKPPRDDPVPPHVRQLVEHELALIAELAYEPYFLTVHDIVAFARSRGILCQGRGSAANSAVCYALGITEVDPSRTSMLFERFISKERNEPPDIDVDFEHQRREEVMQYVFAKYGRERAALAATVITYRPKSALRDVGKALGMDLAQVDRLAGSVAWWDGCDTEAAEQSEREQPSAPGSRRVEHRAESPPPPQGSAPHGPGARRKVLPERLAEAGFDPDNPVIARLVALVNALVGFPRHLSQHVGGFVIARGLLSRLVPVENAAMPERTVIQWDKDDLDALGLLKVDCLSLGMLSAIRRALQMVSQWQGRPFAMQDVPSEDPAVYAMIRRADTVGVFQIESRAQMAMLPRLRPACFYDLVIEVAIVRPGPIQGGMVHPYLRRRQDLEPVTYPSEAVREVLERTLGVPIFQEQVMRLAVVAAGFSPGEADRLRRSMAAWRRKGGLEHFERRLMQGMSERGYSEAFARQIFQQIQGFGEYGFPESHSASFALLVYVSAWLKRHHPAAFCAALLNSQPMGFYAPSQLVQDARRHGVEVLPPDVLRSQWECTLEEPHPLSSSRLEGEGNLASSLQGASPPHLPLQSPPRTRSGGEGRDGGGVQQAQPALRLGLNQIRGLSQAAANRIVAACATAFAGIDDLARRASLDRGELDRLAAAGALAPLSGHRREARWQVAGVEPPLPLLADTPIRETPPGFAPPTEGEDLVADYASLGLTLGRHPLALLRPRLSRRRYHTAEQIRALEHGRPARAAGIVIGRQRPDTASGVIFVTLEDETGHVNVVVWNAVAERQRRELLGSSLLAVHGTVEREGEVVHLVAGRLSDESALLGRLATHSRDFH